MDVVDRVGTSYTQHQNKHVQITTTTPSPFNYRKWPTILCNQSTTSRNFYFKICRIYWSGRPTERSRTRLQLRYHWDSAMTSFLKTTLCPNLSKTSPSSIQPDVKAHLAIFHLDSHVIHLMGMCQAALKDQHQI